MEDALWEQLTDSEKEAWQAVQETLGSVGYKLLKRDLDSIEGGLKEQIFHAQNWDQYCFMKGQLDALAFMLNLESRVLVQLQQAVIERTAEVATEEPSVEDFA